MSAFPEVPHTVAVVSREQAVLALNENRKKQKNVQLYLKY